MVGSPTPSPKTVSEGKKSPGRSKSPKVTTHIPQTPVKPETPNRTPAAAISEKSAEPVQVKHLQTPRRWKTEQPEPPATAVLPDEPPRALGAGTARACAERDRTLSGFFLIGI
ncbi:Transcription initiation factor TFIID subunit 3 [Plecturocebus cupreus]